MARGISRLIEEYLLLGRSLEDRFGTTALPFRQAEIVDRTVQAVLLFDVAAGLQLNICDHTTDQQRGAFKTN